MRATRCSTPASTRRHHRPARSLAKIGLLRGFERVMAVDRKRLDDNHATLRRLNEEAGVTVFNAHDKRIFDDLIGS